MTTNKTDKRKKGIAKLGLAVAVLMGGVLATAQSNASTTMCNQNPIGIFTPIAGYSASVWNDAAYASSGSSNCLTYWSGTNFSVTWNNTYSGADPLDGMGLNNIGKTIDAVNPNANGWHNHKFSNTVGQGVFALYGWHTDRKVEYYIVDDWFGTKPNGRGPQYLKGSIYLDGDTYDIYDYTQASSPGWHQWWSIRRNARTSGVISYAKHFQKWRSLGMQNGTLREARFTVEANKYVGHGKLDVYSIDMLSHAP